MVINTVLRIRTGVWRMPDMSNFLPFATTHSRPCLTRDFSFFFLQLSSAKKKPHAGGYTPRGKGSGFVCAFCAMLYFGPRFNKKFCSLRRCRIVHVFSEVSFSGSILGFSKTTTTTTTTMTTNDDERGPQTSSTRVQIWTTRCLQGTSTALSQVELGGSLAGANF